MILGIRTDKPEAELYLLDDSKIVDSHTWYAHRELSNTLISSIEQLLQKNRLALTDMRGIVVYQGPGSFTGLRIGISVANALGYALDIPVVASQGEHWQLDAHRELAAIKNYQSIVTPFYGSEAHITQPKK